MKSMHLHINAIDRFRSIEATSYGEEIALSALVAGRCCGAQTKAAVRACR